MRKKEGFNCAALRPSTVHALLCRFFLAQASTLLCTYARSGAQTRHTQSERTLVPSLCRMECRYLCEYNVHPSEGALPSSPQRQGGPGDTALRANWTPRLCAVRCALISVLNLSCEVFLLPPHAHEDARRQKIPTKKKCSFRRETHACKQLFFSHFGLRLGLGLSRGALPREHTFFLKLECGNHTYPHLIRTHPSFRSSSSPSSLSPSLVYPPADTIEVLSHPPLTPLRHVPPYAGTLSQARRVITASSFADIPSASLFSSTHSQVLS